MRSLSIFALLDDMLEQFREQADSQHVKIALHRDEEDLILSLDPDQIKQVFINLFQNSLDVMLDGGRLDIAVTTEGNVASITISNTGEAIRPEDIPSLFEPFFSTKPGGTGLGLAVSQKIIQEHGGDLRVISSTARGTSFAVTLPISRKNAKPA